MGIPSLSQCMSKFINSFTAFVYLFTLLGPSLAMASFTQTETEEPSISQAQPVPLATEPTPKSSDNQEEPIEKTGYELKIDLDAQRDGIHFRFINHWDRENSLETFVNRQRPFPFEAFKPVTAGEETIGFTVFMPGFGDIRCDWAGNLKLVGVPGMSRREGVPLALSTGGDVDLSHLSLTTLSLHSQRLTLGKGVKIQGVSLYDIKTLEMNNPGFENRSVMKFISETKIETQASWRNDGHLISDHNLIFSGRDFRNQGHIKTHAILRFDKATVDNRGGKLIGVKGVTLTSQERFLNTDGSIESDGRVYVGFNSLKHVHLGTLSGDRVTLQDLSKARYFRLVSGNVTAKGQVTLMGKSPDMRGVHFKANVLLMDADSFVLGDQPNLKRTVVNRARGENFSLTRPYATKGSLEIWDKAYGNVDEVKAAMLERFGDEKGEMPAPQGIIDLRAGVQAAGGLKFFTPFAKVHLGGLNFFTFFAKVRPGSEKAKTFPEFHLTDGTQSAYADLKAYATVFDLEKGSVVAKDAFIHAPGGIKIGRLVKDKAEDLFSDKLYKQNGSFLLTNQGTTTFKGPLQHRGHLETGHLVFDSPKDHLFEAATGSVLEDCTLKGGGDLYLKRIFETWVTPACCNVAEYIMRLLRSDPSQLVIQKKALGTGAFINEISVFHAGSLDPSLHYRTVDYSTDNTPTAFLFNDTAALYGGSILPDARFTVQHLLHEGFEEQTLPDGCLYLALLQEKMIDGVMDPVSRGTIQAFARALYRYAADTKKPIFSQTSVEEDTFIPAQEGIMTTLGGRVSIPRVIIAVGEAGATIGSATISQIPTRSPLQSLAPEAINIHLIHMSENLKNLMNRQPGMETFFKLRPRHFFAVDEAQQFYAQARPFVRVQKAQGGFETPTGQLLFTLSPSLLLKQVQDQALKTLGRGNIEPNRPLDNAQLLDLHKNFVDYLKEIGHDTPLMAPLTLSNLELTALAHTQERPAPQKPCIAYQSLVNEEGTSELTPFIWIPPEMHHHGDIQTQLLLTIPAGLTLRDWFALAQNNFMLNDALREMLAHSPDLLKLIDGNAQAYQEKRVLENKETQEGVLNVNMPGGGSLPLGEVTLNGKISASKVFLMNTGNVINHADITCQDALLLSLFQNVQMHSRTTRTGNGKNFQDVILNPARVHAEGILKIFAGQNVIFEGAQTHSQLGTHILALAKIFDIPLHKMRQTIREIQGKYKGIETFIDIYSQTSTHTSGDAFLQQSQGSQTLYAPHYDVGSATFESGDMLTFEAAYHQHIETYDAKKGKKHIEGSTVQKSTFGAYINSRNTAAQFLSHRDNIVMIAPQLKSDHGSILRSPNGRVEILLGRNSTEITYNSSSKGMMWNKMVQGGESHFTFTVPSTNGPVKIYAKETILESIKGKHLAFLDNLDVAEGSLINQVVFELHEKYKKTIEGPGMALAVIVAVVVTCCTGGAGLAGAIASGLGGAMSSTAAGILAVGFTAAINTGITNNILDTMSAKGNVFKAAKQSHSKARLKEAAVSGAKAILIGDGSGGGSATSGAVFEGLAQKFAQGVIANTVSAGVDSAVYGTDFQEAFFTGLKTAAVNSVLDTAMDGMKDFISSSSAPDASATGPKTPSSKPAKPSLEKSMGRVTANMVRNFASQSILTGNSREALVKAIAQGAAETAFLGTCGIIDGLMDGVEEPDDSDTPRTDSSKEHTQEERLHHIFNSLHEDVETTTTPQEHIFFGDDGTPPEKPFFMDLYVSDPSKPPLPTAGSYDGPIPTNGEMLAQDIQRDLGIEINPKALESIMNFIDPALNKITGGRGVRSFYDDARTICCTILQTAQNFGDVGEDWGTTIAIHLSEGADMQVRLGGAGNMLGLAVGGILGTLEFMPSKQAGGAGGKFKNPKNVATHEKYRSSLIQNMEKPLVKDQKLSKIVNRLYRDNAKVGSGSTAEAVRYERKTGLPVGGKEHTKKSKELMGKIEKWIQNNMNNPQIINQDMQTAKNLVEDLRGALNGQ